MFEVGLFDFDSWICAILRLPNRFISYTISIASRHINHSEDRVNRRNILGLIFIFVAVFSVGVTSLAEDANSYEYDENGRIEKAVYDDGSYATYSYDANGNLISVEMHEVEASSNNKTTSITPTTTEQDSSGKKSDTGRSDGSKQADAKDSNGASNNDGASTGDAGTKTAIGVMLVSVLGMTALEVHRRKKRLM